MFISVIEAFFSGEPFFGIENICVGTRHVQRTSAHAPCSCKIDNLPNLNFYLFRLTSLKKKTVKRFIIKFTNFRPSNTNNKKSCTPYGYMYNGN